MNSSSLIFPLLFLLGSCSINWKPGRFSFSAGNVSDSSSAVTCAALQAAIGGGSYCSLALSSANPTRYGSGTDSDPYILCSPYQLNAIGDNATLMNKSFRLDADLDMSCIAGDHTPIASSTTGYSGNFDGNEKEISNWTREEAAEDYVGLFAYVDKGIVKDLTLTDATVLGKDYVGILVGSSNQSFFIRIRTTGTVTGNTYVGGINGREAMSLTQSSSSAVVSAASIAGGLVGGGGHTQIGSSSFSGSVTVSAGTAGGLIGSTWGMIANSFNTGNVSGATNNIGGLAGTSSNYIRDSYSTGNISGTISIGGLIGSLTSASSDLRNSFSTGAVTGNGGSAVNVGVLFGTNAGSTTNSWYYSAAACDADSATIGVQACGTTSTGSYAALTDFYTSLNPPLSSWDFQGNTGDGTNNFWEENATNFPVAWYTNPEAFTPAFTGAGTLDSPFLITTEAEFNSIGMNPRLLEYHYRLDADLDFTIPGFTQLSSEEAPFYGSFDGNDNSLSNITISKIYPFTGTFGQVAKGEIKDLTLNALSVTGGIFLGGAVGYTVGTVSNITTNGSINGTYHVGGVVGLLVGTVTNSSSSASVTGPGSALGGLVGNNYGTITHSFSTGNVTNGNSHLGGLVGTSSGTIENSYATGNVATVGPWFSNFGGLVGNLSGSVLNSYATGNVSGANNSYTGGLIGNNGATAVIENCFSTGTVYSNGGAARTGPLVGNSLLTITNSYSLATASCDSGSGIGIQACNALGTGTIPLLTDLHDTDTAPLDQWDFTTIWNSDGLSLPTLQ